MVPPGKSGTIASVASAGEDTVDHTVATLEDGT